MRGFRVLDAAVPADREAWVRLWESSPMRLPFAHPAFAEPMLQPGERLEAAVCDSSAGRVLHAVVVRDVPGFGSDLVSPYGYAGPLVWDAADVEALAVGFWDAFDEWAADAGVVSEFVRFSLVDDVLPYRGTTSPRLVNYVHELPDTEEALWSSYAPKVRQNARRAERSGVTVEFDHTGERLDDFLRIYLSTMIRHDSDAWYRFDARCFERLHEQMAGSFVYVYAMHEGRAVSADLVLMGAQTAYYYLGGTDEDAFLLRPNELVKTAALEFARATGRTRFVLGGGVETGDGLERYKRGFAPDGAQMFCSGERVLDSTAYAELTRSRSARFDSAAECGDQPDWVDGPAFFPAYRRRFTAAEPALRTEEPVR